MPVTLDGRPIVIAGASSGIGRATAVRCARAGMPVIATARRMDRLVDLVESIRAEGGAAEPVECDVTDQAQCGHAVERCVDLFGAPHAVLANAGYGLEQPVHATTDREMRDIFEVNVFGTLNAIRPAIPHMLANRAGHILITSSSIGVLPVSLHGHYGATKAAQHHLGRAMGAELRHHGVRVSTIHPVGTKTEFFDRMNAGDDTVEPASTPPSDRAGGSSNTPAAFMQTADTVARAIVRCLRRPRSEVWPGGTWWVRWGMAAGIAVPNLASPMMRARARRADQA